MTRVFPWLVAVVAAASSAGAATCPPPLEFTERRSALLAEVQTVRDANAGRYLTRELFAIWATAPDRRAQQLLDRGLEARARHDDLDEIKAFTALIAYCPTYAEGWAQRGLSHLRRGQYQAALSDFEAALKAAPDHLVALAGRGSSLIGTGQVTAGEAALRSALNLNPWLPLESPFLAPRGTAL